MARTFPPEDIQKFYETTLDMVNQGGCVSARDATDRAFTHLRQRGGEWQDKPYGPNIAKAILSSFSEEQTIALQTALGIYVPEKVRAAPAQGRTGVFERDTDLRERFLTRVAEGASRPQLAVEFDVQPEHLSLALTIAVRKQGGGSFAGVSASLLKEKIALVAAQRPEWAPLAALPVQKADLITREKQNWQGQMAQVTSTANGAQITAPGWDLPVSDEEKELIRRMKLEQEKRSGSSTLDTDNLYSGGEGSAKSGFAQRVADSLIGTGNRIFKR